MNNYQIVSFQQQIQACKGSSITNTDVRKELEKLRNQKAIENGKSPYCLDPIANQTICNYTCHMAHMLDFTIRAKAQMKTVNREVVENSRIAAVSYLVTLAAMGWTGSTKRFHTGARDHQK